MGGDVYNADYYVKKAKQLEDMGADTVCIKDMAGLISPYDAYILIKTLKQEIKVPIHLHSHFTSGQSCMALLKAIEAGVDIVDTVFITLGLSHLAPGTRAPGDDPERDRSRSRF